MMRKNIKVSEIGLKKIVRRLIAEEVAILEGTGNFYNKNASHIFALSSGNEGNDDDFDPDDWESYVQDVISNICDMLEKVGGFRKMDEWEDDAPRSFQGRKFAAIKKYKTFPKDDEIEVCIECIVRSGYYDGCNFDWVVKYNNDPVDEGESGYFNSASANKWAVGVVDKLVKLVEAAYKQYTERYTVAGRFSNGETIYNRVTESINEANTPWGQSDSEYKLLPGFIWYGTPSHGGLKVAAGVAVKKLSPQALNIGRYSSGAYWFEEDVAYCAPFYEIPELREAADKLMGGRTDVDHLKSNLEHYYPEYFDKKTTADTVTRANEFKTLSVDDEIEVYEKPYKVYSISPKRVLIQSPTGNIYKLTKNLYIKDGKLIKKSGNAV